MTTTTSRRRTTTELRRGLKLWRPDVKRRPLGTRAEEILEFWFGPRLSDPNTYPPDERTRRWFGGGEALDETIRCRFGDDSRWALRGDLDTWQNRAHSLLALTLLLDQFPRHLYRGCGTAFIGDTRAQRVVLAGIDAGVDRELHPVERAFLYMPLMHAESRELQQKSVACFDALVKQAPKDQRSHYSHFAEYAQKHRAIVDRFGRFPHRNAALARPTTAEEAAFLAQPGSSF